MFSLFKKNDWRIVHIESPVYEITPTLIIGSIVFEKNKEKYDTNVYCELWYSEIRNKYKIKFSGFPLKNPKEDITYHKCLSKQIELSK